MSAGLIHHRVFDARPLAKDHSVIYHLPIRAHVMLGAWWHYSQAAVGAAPLLVTGPLIINFKI
jgi:transposase